jgi:hypothetical protein
MSLEKQGFSSFFKCTGEREKREKRELFRYIIEYIFLFYIEFTELTDGATGHRSI